MNDKTTPSLCKFDIFFIIFSACYTILGLWGLTLLSSNGLRISGDLCCYAQNLAADLQRGAFTLDPLLSGVTPANSIPSLQSTLAALFSPGGNVAVGLFRAAAVGVFFHYVGYYYLGRRLLEKPLAAALLSLLMGVTAWVSFGTYWGFGSGDVTPRVFFAALFPLLLLGTLSALDKPCLRPLVLFVSGCGMYLHSISSLVASCMLFTVFFFRRPAGQSLVRHMALLALSLALWSIPTFLFLHGSLEKHFTPAELEMFQQVFLRRFLEDQGGLWSRLAGHFLPGSDSFPLVLGGIAGYFITRRFGTPPMKRVTSLVPVLLLGLALVMVLSISETYIAHRLQRLPMGQELPRGIRFMIPLCWLMISCAFSCFWNRFPRISAAVAVVVIIGVLGFDQGRWAVGVRFGARELLGMEHTQREQTTLQRGASYREALEAVCTLVPPDAPIFAEPDAMAVRYVLFRPLAYSFKDGSSYLYNQDAQGAARWLALTHIRDTEGLPAAWKASGAQWILSRWNKSGAEISKVGSIVWTNKHWFIATRINTANPVTE